MGIKKNALGHACQRLLPSASLPSALSWSPRIFGGKSREDWRDSVEYTLGSSICFLHCCKKLQPTSSEQHRHIHSQFCRSEAQKQGVSRKNGILLQAPGENSFLCLFQQLPGATHTPGLTDFSSSKSARGISLSLPLTLTLLLPSYKDPMITSRPADNPGSTPISRSLT